MSYPVFLINLDRQPERLAFMTAQLDALGITAIRIAAVDGRNPAERAKAPVAWYASLTPGEVGCFESHRRLWQRIVDEGLEGALVIEDDVVVSSDFGFLNFEGVLARGADLIKIDQDARLTGAASIYGLTSVECGHKRCARRLLGTELCTGGYFVSQAGARKLLSLSRNYFVPVDRFMFDDLSKSFWQLNIWKVEDSAVSQTRALFQTQDDDSISAHRASGNEKTRASSFIRTNATRFRRLLDNDMKHQRTARRAAHVGAFAETEGIQEKQITFSSPSLAHVPLPKENALQSPC